MKYTLDADLLEAGELSGPALVLEAARQARARVPAPSDAAPIVRRGAGTQQEIIWPLPTPEGRYRGVALLVSVLDGATWATLTLSPSTPGLRRGILIAMAPAIVLGALVGVPFATMLPGELQVLPPCGGVLVGLGIWFAVSNHLARRAVADAPAAVHQRMADLGAALRAMGAREEGSGGLTPPRTPA